MLVYQGLTLTISQLPERNNNYTGWKQRTCYEEYFELWKNLIGTSDSSDRKRNGSKASTDGSGSKNDEWNNGLNYDPKLCADMQVILYNQLIADILRILQTLNLSVFEEKKDQDDNDNQQQQQQQSSPEVQLQQRMKTNETN